MLSQGQKHSFIQNALIVAINDPSFNFTLPELGVSTWDDLLTRSDERERLEFVGDALMHACVALELYKVFPDATPGLYTTLRAALNANATFTHFMIHVGAFEGDSTGRTKVAADAFETVIGSYYIERGFDALCTWVADMLKPLIAVAAKASLDFSKVCIPSKRQKRVRDQGPCQQRRIKMARSCSMRPPGHRLTYRGKRDDRTVTHNEQRKSSGHTLQSSVICEGPSLTPIPQFEIIDLTGDVSDDEWTDSEDSTRQTTCIANKSRYPCFLSPPHSKPQVLSSSAPPTTSQPLHGDFQMTTPAADSMDPLPSVPLVLHDVTSISANCLRGESQISNTTSVLRSSEDSMSSFVAHPLSSPVAGGGTPHKAPDDSSRTIAPKATFPSLAKVRAITKGLRNVSSIGRRQGDPIPMCPSRSVRTPCVVTPHHFQTQGPSSMPHPSSNVIRSLPDLAYLDPQRAMLGGPETPIVIDDDEDETVMA